MNEEEKNEVLRFLERQGIDSIEKVKILLEPPFFAIIPLEILENPNLSSSAKILYAEILALSKKTGICFATNNYLAQRLSLHPLTIPRLLKQLKDFALIHLTIERNSDGSFREIKPNFVGLTFYGGGIGKKSKKIKPKEEGGLTIYRGGINNLYRGGLTNYGGQKRNIQKEIYNNDEKSSKGSDFRPLVRYFIEKCEQVKGYKPELPSWNVIGSLIARRRRTLSDEEIKDLIDFYLTSKKSREFGGSIKVALSDATVNEWREKTNKEGYV